MTMIKQILYMSVMWTTLIFIGYNVLTTAGNNNTNMTIPNEALGSVEEKHYDCSSISEPDDDFYCKEFDWEPYVPDREIVEEMCDASEDYAKNPKNCDKAYDLVEKAEKEEQEREDKKLEDICDDVDGKWTKDGCETDHDGPKADKFEEKVTELHQQESEPEQTVVEDWRNTVEPIDDVKINSPFLMVPIDKDDDEKEIDEKVEKYIADYNEKEEETNEALNADVEEEEEEEDESEEDEEESEEEDSDSEESDSEE